MAEPLNPTPQQQSEILMQALPHMLRYDDAIVVVKYGGHAMGDEDKARDFAKDMVLLEQSGINPVVVHGGGPQIGMMLKKLGIESHFSGGLRGTDKVDSTVLEQILGRELIPVLAPVAQGADGQTYNVNADTFAGAVAGALGAKRLLLLTDVPGVLDKNKDLIKELRVDDIRGLIADGTITGGMIPKVETCIYALEQGVEGVVILDGKIPHAVLIELLTDHGVGTLITR